MRRGRERALAVMEGPETGGVRVSAIYWRAGANDSDLAVVLNNGLAKCNLAEADLGFIPLYSLVGGRT